MTEVLHFLHLLLYSYIWMASAALDEPEGNVPDRAVIQRLRAILGGMSTFMLISTSSSCAPLALRDHSLYMVCALFVCAMPLALPSFWPWASSSSTRGWAPSHAHS